MRDLNKTALRATVTLGGHLSLTTPSCGCCSEHFCDNPDAYSPDWKIDIDRLVQLQEEMQDEVDRLRDYIAERANSGLTSIIHTDVD